MNLKSLASSYLISVTGGKHSQKHHLHSPATWKVGSVQSLTAITSQLSDAVMVVADVEGLEWKKDSEDFLLIGDPLQH